MECLKKGNNKKNQGKNEGHSMRFEGSSLDNMIAQEKETEEKKEDAKKKTAVQSQRTHEDVQH